MAAPQVTDRALRYRAQNAMPEHVAVCVFCGRPAEHQSGPRPVLEVMHLDGREENSSPDNLSWGCRSCNVAAGYSLRRAGKGRLTRQFNPSKSGGAESLRDWMQAVGAIRPHTDRGQRGLVSHMPVSEAIAMIRATPHSKRSQFASEIRERKRNPWPFSSSATSPLMTTSARGGIAQHMKGRRAKETAGSAGSYKGYSMKTDSDGEFYSSLDPDSRFSTKQGAKKHIDWFLKGRGNPTAFDRCVDSVSRKGSASDPRAVCAAAGRKKYGQAEMTRRAVAGKRKAARSNSNPAAGAIEAYEEFHGREPDEFVTVEKHVHFHRHLAGAGKLMRLEILGIDGQVHTITAFRGALLTFNEARNQLFVEGGDQSVNLEDYGITEPHELETLGKVRDIGYFTTKDHLGEEGGTATYVHRFRTTNENGKHVVVEISRYPDLIYRVRDEALEFSGGSYVIRAEGIDR